MHIPVLLEETVAALAPRPGCVYVDGTLGQAGHAAAVMRLAGPGGTLLGIDRDGEALARAEANLRRGDVPGRHLLAHGGHGDLEAIAHANGIEAADAILLDLGVSSDQLDTPGRGFSFRADGPLDMRMRNDAGETAAALLARLGVEEMARLFRELGEEGFRLVLGEGAAVVDVLEEGAARDVFHDEADPGVELEPLEKVDDQGVVEFHEDVELAMEGFGDNRICLVEDLDRYDLLGLLFNCLVDLSKGAAADGLDDLVVLHCDN